MLTSQAVTGSPKIEPSDPDDEQRKKDTKYFKYRKEQSKIDSHRSVGGSNRVVMEGKRYLDADTGNYIFVKGDRVVIRSPDGRNISQFKNPKSNTLNRLKSGKWIPM